jgi:hypothetical protein
VKEPNKSGKHPDEQTAERAGEDAGALSKS